MLVLSKPELPGLQLAWCQLIVAYDGEMMLNFQNGSDIHVCSVITVLFFLATCVCLDSTTCLAQFYTGGNMDDLPKWATDMLREETYLSPRSKYTIYTWLPGLLIHFWFKFNLERSTMHPKFNLTRIRANDLWIKDSTFYVP